MASTKSSANNPFRSLGVSPTLHSTSDTTTSSSFSNSMEGSSSAAETSQSTSHAESTPTSEQSRSQLDDLGIEEDMPPAYTPSADVYQGESTVEVGPRRAFQQPPQHPQNQQYLSPQGTGWPQSQPSQRPPNAPYGSPTNSWTGYPGNARSIPRSSGGPLRRALTEIVRDVVDVIAGPEQRPYQQQPYPPNNTYAVPNASAPVPTPIPRSVPPSQQNNSVPDDGSPTTTPMPGHPLLKDGRLLVYPNAYICVKCRNTGYKNHDPSHPCRKCWDKYSRPYTGALAYTPWSNHSSSSRSTFQRPLPAFTPPPMALYSSPNPASAYAAPQAYNPSPYNAPQNGPNQQPYNQERQFYVYNSSAGLYPPPGAHVVKPGDARLGGSVCWKCGGYGNIPLLIIDTRPCPVCGGTGRTHQ